MPGAVKPLAPPGERVARAKPATGEGPSAAQRIKNYHSDALGIGQNVVVPEPQHTPPLPLEPFGPRGVGFVVRMLTAIGFNDEPMLQAHEIDDVSADGPLAPELVTGHSPVAKYRPEAPFGVGGGLPERPGELMRHGTGRPQIE